MPKILEIKEINGNIWCRVGTPGDFESGITLWTPDEQREKYHEGLKRGAEIAANLPRPGSSSPFWIRGFRRARELIEQAILGEIEDAPSSSYSPDS